MVFQVSADGFRIAQAFEAHGEDLRIFNNLKCHSYWAGYGRGAVFERHAVEDFEILQLFAGCSICVWVMRWPLQTAGGDDGFSRIGGVTSDMNGPEGPAEVHALRGGTGWRVALRINVRVKRREWPSGQECA